MSVSNQTGWPSVPVAETAVPCGTRMGTAGLAGVGVKLRYATEGRAGSGCMPISSTNFW